MQFYKNQYYHIFNRTNNDEGLFRSRENYLYFLKKYRYYLDEYFQTIAYCLMPTHYHFLVKVIDNNADNDCDGISLQISRAMQTLQSSYTKAVNIRYNRHGALFQAHFKAKFLNDEKYYLALANYIHQNPLRSNLVIKAEEWEFSSYQEYIGLRNGNLPNKDLLLSQFSVKEIIKLTHNRIVLDDI